MRIKLSTAEDPMVNALENLIQAAEQYEQRAVQLRRSDNLTTDGVGSRKNRAIMNYAAAEEFLFGCIERARKALERKEDVRQSEKQT